MSCCPGSALDPDRVTGSYSHSQRKLVPVARASHRQLDLPAERLASRVIRLQRGPSSGSRYYVSDVRERRNNVEPESPAKLMAALRRRSPMKGSDRRRGETPLLIANLRLCNPPKVFVKHGNLDLPSCPQTNVGDGVLDNGLSQGRP